MPRSIPAVAAVLFLAAVATGCATTGATWRSGVADTYLQRAPWYAGAGVLPGATIAHVPITFQRGATQPGPFDPRDTEGTPLGELIAEMNSYLDGLRATRPVAASAGTPQGTAPDVQFGCERQPHDDCEGADLDRGMRLAVGRPSATWATWAAAAADASGADRVLVITLEVGNYLPRQKNWRGSKEVDLGTGYSVDVPWLTALDRPVNVLQITGVLVDRDGRAVRIGAEGLVARRTHVVLSGFGVQALVSDDDVARVRTERRSDLPGQPLVWQAALQAMVAQLTGAPRLTAR